MAVKTLEGKNRLFLNSGPNSHMHPVHIVQKNKRWKSICSLRPVTCELKDNGVYYLASQLAAVVYTSGMKSMSHDNLHHKRHHMSK